MPNHDATTKRVLLEPGTSLLRGRLCGPGCHALVRRWLRVAPCEPVRSGIDLRVRLYACSTEAELHAGGFCEPVYAAHTALIRPAASTVPVVRKLRRATEFAIEWVGMHGAPHAVKFRVFLP